MRSSSSTSGLNSSTVSTKSSSSASSTATRSRRSPRSCSRRSLAAWARRHHPHRVRCVQERLVEEGYNLPMAHVRCVGLSCVFSRLAEEVLSGRIKDGDHAEVDVDENKKVVVRHKGQVDTAPQLAKASDGSIHLVPLHCPASVLRGMELGQALPQINPVTSAGAGSQFFHADQRQRLVSISWPRGSNLFRLSFSSTAVSRTSRAWLEAQGCDAVLAAGAVLDAGKLLAHRLSLPCIIVPLSASTCAGWTASPTSIPSGCAEGDVPLIAVQIYLPRSRPVRQAPPRTLASGVADALAMVRSRRQRRQQRWLGSRPCRWLGCCGINS